VAEYVAGWEEGEEWAGEGEGEGCVAFEWIRTYGESCDVCGEDLAEGENEEWG
jgi:hypothetical protein